MYFHFLCNANKSYLRMTFAPVLSLSRSLLNGGKVGEGDFNGIERQHQRLISSGADFRSEMLSPAPAHHTRCDEMISKRGRTKRCGFYFDLCKYICAETTSAHKPSQRCETHQIAYVIFENILSHIIITVAADRAGVAAWRPRRTGPNGG